MLNQVWGTLLIFTLCPLLGALPLIDWIVRSLTGKHLSQIGSRNISVSAAFYHGGRWVGLLAVLSEASKGMVAVLLARAFFPPGSAWEVIALIFLVAGRYWVGKGAGTTNVVWGYLVHDPVTAGLVAIVGGIGFTILRERQLGRLGVLILLTLMTALRYPTNGLLVWATATLSIFMGWVYQKIPDDLEMPLEAVPANSRQVFRFFQGDRSRLSLVQSLRPEKVGYKAANLSQLMRWGYPVPMGWVLLPGDDPLPLIQFLNPSSERVFVVRSSAIGEDTPLFSAAGQYQSILGITSQSALDHGILRCQSSYNFPAAVHYRQQNHVPDSGLAVIIQAQIPGIFSGVAFSRDPIQRSGDAIVIEALPGMADQVVSGQRTPEQYRVWISTAAMLAHLESQSWQDPLQIQQAETGCSWFLPLDREFPLQRISSANLGMENSGTVPPRLIQQVAFLARHIEHRCHGIPQDIEWTFDGQRLWLLQARPITTLSPLWTRKIAAEVIPGSIRPLTWSINRPLTCRVWGEIFTVVLGDRAQDLDFNQTATLHHSAAYFNATLLGEIFLRMGLPPESLEFLTQGAKFTKPPLFSTLRNLPGLLRLLQAELNLERSFDQDDRNHFQPGFTRLTQGLVMTGLNSPSPLTRVSIAELSADAQLNRIQQILELLERATYYNIMVPLSVALRQALFKVPETQLDPAQLPEVRAVRSLQALAQQGKELLPTLTASEPTTCFERLAETATGQRLLEQFQQILDQYGYLSEVGTDIAVPTWREDPAPLRALFVQFLCQDEDNRQNSNDPKLATTANLQSSMQSSMQSSKSKHHDRVQRRLNLKGRVTTLYSQLLAELRWSILDLEQHGLAVGFFNDIGDIFFLELEEIHQAIAQPGELTPETIKERIRARRANFEKQAQVHPPFMVYGNEPPCLTNQAIAELPPIHDDWQITGHLQGIGASPGQVTGQILVLFTLQSLPEITKSTILVVPYTDAGWIPLLARAGGLIAEVGGQLSHGAIIAREYGIPAVMNIPDATQRLRSGQWVRLDGERGAIEILE